MEHLTRWHWAGQAWVTPPDTRNRHGRHVEITHCNLWIEYEMIGICAIILTELSRANPGLVLSYECRSFIHFSGEA